MLAADSHECELLGKYVKKYCSGSSAAYYDLVILCSHIARIARKKKAKARKPHRKSAS